MRCVRIEYTDFRNLRREVYEPSEGINLLLGENAAGKTNAVEGIYLFAAGRSFRGSADASLIRFGSAAAGLRLRFDAGGENGRERELELRFAQPRIPEEGDERPAAECRRVAVVDGESVRRLSEFVGIFRAVIFAPEDLSVVKNGPSARRDFLDSALSRLYPQYLAALSRYNQILRQRNALLRSQARRGVSPDDPVFRASLAVWSEQLAPIAAQIASERALYVERLSASAGEFMREMSGGREILTLSAEEPKDAESYLRALSSSTERELGAGTTLYGIHRDDISVMLGGLSARLFASQGQQRSAALAMKLAEGEVVRQIRGDYPVFLLDDVLSELDPSRQSWLLGGLASRQVIITAAQKPASCEGAKITIVRGGKMEN